jgi:hypothetical protein
MGTAWSASTDLDESNRTDEARDQIGNAIGSSRLSFRRSFGTDYLTTDYLISVAARQLGSCLIGPHTSSSRVVLVVDDEPAVLHMMARALVEAGYTVHTSSNGQEAIDLAVALAGPPGRRGHRHANGADWRPRNGGVDVRAETRLPVSLCQRLWARGGLQRAIRSFSA